MKKVSGVWSGNTTINPLHHEEEMQSINRHMTLKGNFKQPALSLHQRDDCKTRNDTMYCTTKQGQNTKHPQTIVATMNQQQQTHRLRTLSRSYCMGA